MNRQREKGLIDVRMQGTTVDILMYGIIGLWEGNNAFDFATELKRLQQAGASLVNLRFNCYGGEVNEGIAMFNAIKSSAIPVDGYVEGICASMGSILLQACRNKYISKYGRVMTHQPQGGAWGTSAELRSTADHLDAVERIACQMMADNMQMTADQVKADFLQPHERWFNAEQAIAAGLCTSMYDGVEPMGVMPSETMSNAAQMCALYRTEPRPTICII